LQERDPISVRIRGGDITNGTVAARAVKLEKSRVTRGRCYDHNFLRFSTIFGDKIGVFLKNQCYDQNYA
jgi:hypothetical protein